ncbi:hypothetical protein DM01DRAFT_1338195 [Hesseltinella vesiculosa]|uniref:RGS domain-containing protein n=1 Tax=Hesseltinella vesiculosa TaxID=101127 RepID=A0A1X2GAZ3_9FUNG|nr:hypothetical protein DM01DRAFT_1338195 [Hesseltinella vesiculosa]
MEKIHHYHGDEAPPFHWTTPSREFMTHVLEQLPTLDDVLQRQSRPPVCLYNYYIVLRDRLHMETLLDFWLDVQQAEVLHRRYMRQQQRKKSQADKKLRQMSPVSPISPYNSAHSASSLSIPSPRPTSPHPSSLASEPEILTHMLLMHAHRPPPHQPPTTYPTKRSTTTTMGSQSSATTSTSALPHLLHQPTQMDMIDAVERIYLRYIVPHAEKELHALPLALRDQITRTFADKSQTLEDPKVFAPAKRYVHIVLESSFSLFLRYKVFMNLTLPQQLARLVIGLIALLLGLTLEFSLIFLDIMPWSKRLWGIIPLTIAIYCLCSSITGLDPMWVLVFNVSETTTLKFNAIKQVKVRQILRKRSLFLSLVMLSLILLLLVIFCSVPGHRL